ncbi:MAG: type II secretion system F family protein [Actinomycetaceae bacterium]|nr:type II secretion system F family protein [Actinomycetaceae bacterium]
MGVLVGLGMGLGIAMIAGVVTGAFPEIQARPSRQRLRAGPGAVWVLASAGLCALLAYGALRTAAFALVVGVAGAAIPGAFARGRRRRRVEAARQEWPDVLDDVVSALRAGLGIGESLAAVSRKGPERMRGAFARFADQLRATGRLDPALDHLKESMDDPVADRVVEAMRLASRLGGHDLASMMERLASTIRRENRARGELVARQSWTVNGARVAAAAPWIVLALLATRPGTVEAFASPAGTAILVGGFLATVVAYWLMLRIGRLPDQPRVLAGGDTDAGRASGHPANGHPPSRATAGGAAIAAVRTAKGGRR